MIQRGDDLGPQQLRALLACVRELSALDSVDDFFAHAIKTTRCLLGDDWLACESYRQHDIGYIQGLVTPEVPEDLYQLYQTRAAENPLFGVMNGAYGPADSLTWRQVMSNNGDPGHDKLAIYHDFYKPLDIDNQLVTWSCEPDGSLLVYALSRRGDYSAAEITLAEMLRPHLVNAYRTWKSLKALAREPDWLVAGLEELQAGLIALDDDGQVTRTTPRACALLDTYFSGTRRPAGRLPVALSRWVHRAIAPGRDAFIAPAPYLCRIPDQGLSIRLTPSPGGGYLLIFKEIDRKPTPEELMQRWGLSRRRAEVLALMAAGMNNPQIAEALGLTVATVRKHLEYIYDQLNVSSRTEAVTQVLSSKQGA